MAISSRRLAAIISSIAASIYFFIIILQVPLFSLSISFSVRIPCKEAGTCRTPLELTCYQLMASEIFFLPTFAIKVLLYPGAVAEAFIYNNPIPKFNHLLIKSCQNFDFHQIEVLVSVCNKLMLPFSIYSQEVGGKNVKKKQTQVIAGSYLCVAGALISILKPGRLSLFGTIIILWGLKMDHFLGDQEHEFIMKIYPTFWFALLLSFLSIKSDARALIRCFRF
ncbi:uncharacterized protein LOC124939219 [Impatiens glandulifera]|uniref:uncharacterized protein LOC124939219 n=1 Tax=Impatiens glandulifera TaxID=253017 RepID=UPI001FB19646|nr:uncharacterized protein LOC124939219 [Impatiens glandulifera]